MTVAELMQILAAQPGERRVVVDGYEGGVDDIEGVDVVAIMPNANAVRQGLGYRGEAVPMDVGVGRHALAPDLRGEMAIYIKRET